MTTKAWIASSATIGGCLAFWTEGSWKPLYPGSKSSDNSKLLELIQQSTLKAKKLLETSSIDRRIYVWLRVTGELNERTHRKLIDDTFKAFREKSESLSSSGAQLYGESHDVDLCAVVKAQTDQGSLISEDSVVVSNLLRRFMFESEFERLKGDPDNLQFGLECAAVIDRVRNNCEAYLANVVAEFKEVVSRAEKLGWSSQAKLQLSDAGDRLLQSLELGQTEISDEMERMDSAVLSKRPLEFRSLPWSLRLEHIRAVGTVSEARGRTELGEFLRSVVGVNFNEYEDYQKFCKDLRATAETCFAAIIYDGHPCNVSSIHPKRTNGMFRFSEGSTVWCSITSFPECRVATRKKKEG